MKKSIYFIFAAAMSVSAAARAAEVNFDGSKANGLDTFTDVMDIVSDLAGDKPQHPGQPGQPGPGHDNNHPGPGHDNNHPGPQPQPWHPGPQPQPWHPGPQPQPWNPPTPPQPYSPVYPDMNCETWEFTAQTPNTRTEKITGEEQSFDCYFNNGMQYCRPTGNYFSRKITVNIGDRKLESWEKESLKVCLDSAHSARVDTSGMIYEYAVSSKDNDGFFNSSTVFTLTPGAKKPAQPDANELSMTFAGVTTAGDVRITLKDTRADYFKGEKITINADGMNIPEITPDMPVDQVLNSFVKFNVTAAFDVAGSYELKLMDAPKPGKYVVTIKFFRSGPLSSGAETSTMETFELK